MRLLPCFLCPGLGSLGLDVPRVVPVAITGAHPGELGAVVALVTPSVSARARKRLWSRGQERQ